MLREFCQMTVGAVDTARVSLADIFVDRFAEMDFDIFCLFVIFGVLFFIMYIHIWQRRGISVYMFVFSWY